MFNVFFKVIFDYVININIWGMNLVWFKFIWFNNFFNFSNGNFICCCGYWVEIYCCVMKYKIIVVVGFLCFNNGKFICN